MSGEDLMAPLVGDDRFEGEVLRIGIALERLRINCELIDSFGAAAAILGAAGLTIYMAIFDVSHETNGFRKGLGSLLAGQELRRRNRPWGSLRHLLTVSQSGEGGKRAQLSDALQVVGRQGCEGKPPGSALLASGGVLVGLAALAAYV
jgi:hypothetical protein